LSFSDGEKAWALSVWGEVILSLTNLGLTFSLSVKTSRTKAMYALIALLPGLLALPTAFLIG